MSTQDHSTRDPAVPPPDSRASRSRRRKWLLIAAAVVLIVPIAAVSLAALLLPSEVVARAAASRAEAALGVPVEIGDLEIDLIPVPSVSLLSTRVGPDEAPVASVEQILLRPRLWPLLSGRVIVREIAITRPDVHLVVDSAGNLNLPLGGGDEQSGDPSTAEVEFSIDEFGIRDGRLRYTDLRDGTSVALHDLQQTLRVDGRMEAGTLARIGLTGCIGSDSVDASLPGRLAVPLRGVRFALQHDAELDRETDRLQLSDFRLELQRLALSGRGHIASFSDSLARFAELELRAEEFGFADLAESLPEGFLAELLAGREADTAAAAQGPPATLEYDGRASIAATINGPITPDTLPRVDGEIAFNGVAVRRNGASLLSGAQGSIAFTNVAVSSDEVTGSLFGQPFTLSFAVNDLAEPVVDFATRGTAVLETLLAQVESEEPIEASGALPFDLRGRLVPSDPAASVVEGTIGMRGARASLPSLQQPVEIRSGVARFAGEQLRLEELALAFGESRLTATASIRDWLPVALGDSTGLALVDFNAQGETIDLDALLGPSESEYTPVLFARLADRTINGQTAAEAAEALGFSLPELPRVRARGELVVARLVRNGLAYENVEVSLESSPTAVSAPRVRFGLMGGTVELGLALERAEEQATLVGVYHLENVGAGAFFSRFTPFKDRLSGLMTVDGELSLQLDQHMLPVRPTVRSSGQLALTSGSLSNWPVLAQAGQRLGLQSFDTLAFREWSGEYLIAGPLVTLDRAVQLSPGVDTELAGSFDFAGQLDLAVIARLSPELASAAGEQVRSAAASLAGDEQAIPVGLRITGSAANPSIALDLSAARDQAIARARERATQEAESAAQRAAAEVAGQVLGDSVPVSPEGIGEAVRGRVQDRIRGLFGRRGGGAAADSATADTSTADSSARKQP